jgi:lactoylglutathione lyase
VKRKACSLLVAALAAFSAADKAPERPRVIGIASVAFSTHDLDASRTFYKNLLGYQEPAPGAVHINNRQSLLLVPEPEAGSDRLVKIVFETDNAEGLRVYLKSRGITVPEKAARAPRGNVTFTVTDPDGHTVEFIQYGLMPDGPDRKPTWKKRPNANPKVISSDLRHAGILVGALEPAMAFYRDILGFKETWRGSRDEKELNWVNMQVPDGDDYIEFMLYRDLPEPSKRGSQHHICLFVPDIEKAASILRGRAAAAGYTRAMEVRTGTNRKRQLNLYDPDGTRTELMEPTTVDGKPAPSSTAPPPR